MMFSRVIKGLLLIFTVLVTSTLVVSQTKHIEDFVNDDDNVSVFFFDPVIRLNELDKSFSSRSDQEKSDALDKYLHENPLYSFRLMNSKNKSIRYLVIRGNPAKTNTKMFYKVEVVRNPMADFDPNNGDYSDKIVQVIDEVNCGGTLFESMTMFDAPEKKKLVGNGVQLFGYYRRVQPYAEIRKSIISIIQHLRPA